MTDIFGNAIQVGAYVVHASSNGMQICRVVKLVSELKFTGEIKTRLVVEKLTSVRTWRNTYSVRNLKNLIVISEEQVPVALRPVKVTATKVLNPHWALPPRY